MATYTTNYKIKKPESIDFYDIEDFNSAMDIVDTKLHTCEEDTKNAEEAARNAAQEVLDGKANKSTVLKATVLSSAWMGYANKAPFNAHVTVTAVTASNGIEVTLGDATEEEALACAEAQILKITQEDGGIMLHAYGEKPAIDIPIIVIVRGDL